MLCYLLMVAFCDERTETPICALLPLLFSLMRVLVIDQFEEVLTLGRRNKKLAETTKNFLTELGDLVEGRPPASLQALLETAPGEVGRYSFARHNYKVILSLREDFLPELETLKLRIPSLGLNRFRIRPAFG